MPPEPHPPRHRHASTLGLAVALLVPACAVTTPPAAVPAPPPPQWQAPLPHGGQLTDLTQWWSTLGDPALTDFMAAAQQASPSLSSARSRIGQARLNRVVSQAALGPTMDATGSLNRGNTGLQPLATTAQAGLGASWEVDLFGSHRLAANAAEARLEGAQAQWHDARVAVAAEVASLVLNHRSCEKLLAVARSDAASRSQTAALTEQTARAGLAAPATAAMARASAAEGQARVTQQQGLCDLDIKALVALTALAEPVVRQKMAPALANAAQPAIVSIASLPANVVAQRPDVFGAEREVLAAAADVGTAQALGLPRLALSGNIGLATNRSGGMTTDGSTWSLGPLSLRLPLFDGGTSAAQVDAARARYEDAVVQYTARVRQAVREVEESLVQLQSTGARMQDAEVAAQGYRAAFVATEARYKAGLASLVELEDTRRTALAAETALLGLQRERVGAWVALYRAAGGGWQASMNSVPAPTVAGARP